MIEENDVHTQLRHDIKKEISRFEILVVPKTQRAGNAVRTTLRVVGKDCFLMVVRGYPAARLRLRMVKKKIGTVAN